MIHTTLYFVRHGQTDANVAAARSNEAHDSNVPLNRVGVGQAAAVARENAERLGLTERIDIHVGDLLAPLAGRLYDMILSNPPYIPTADIAGLMPDVRSYEPHLALDGGADGLNIYRRLMSEAPALLKDGGAIAGEGGIGEALIATATGLLVAIFALVVHTYFAQRMDTMLTLLEKTMNTLLAGFAANDGGRSHAS